MTTRSFLVAAVGVLISASVLAPPAAKADTSRAVQTGDYGQRVIVSATEGLNPQGQRITVRGRKFDPRVGVYVALCVEPKRGEAPSPCGGGVDMQGSSGASAWVSSNPPPYARNLVVPFKKNGKFKVTLNVSSMIGDIDCQQAQCAVTVRADHTRSRDRSHDVIVPVDFG